MQNKSLNVEDAANELISMLCDIGEEEEEEEEEEEGEEDREDEGII